MEYKEQSGSSNFRIYLLPYFWSTELFKWLTEKQIKVNLDKWQLICITNEPIYINNVGENIINDKNRKLLDVKFDKEK